MMLRDHRLVGISRRSGRRRGAGPGLRGPTGGMGGACDQGRGRARLPWCLVWM